MLTIPRLFKWMLLLVVGAGLAIGGVVVWLQYYVRTEAFAQSVKRKASELAGAPVDFRDLRWDIGRGLTLDQIAIERSVEGGEQPDSLFSADQIILKYNWQSFWRRQFEITRLTFKSPTLVVSQTSGDWILPFNPPESRELESQASSPVEAFLTAFNLDDGTVVIDGENDETLLRLTGVQIEGQQTQLEGGKEATAGVLYIGSLSLWEGVRMSQLQSPFEFEEGILTLTSIQAEAYHGKLTGRWQQQLTQPSRPYHGKLDAEKLDVGMFVESVSGLKSFITGKLDAKSSWLGPASEPAKVSGEGTVEVHDGRILDFPLFRQLAGRLPGLGALAHPDFQEIRASYTIARQQVRIQNFEMRANLFQIAGTGTVGFDQKLKGNLVVSLSPRLVEQLPRRVRNLMDQEDDGYASFRVGLGGTVLEPSVGIPLSDQLKERTLDGLRKFFSPEKSEEQEPAAPAQVR